MGIDKPLKEVNLTRQLKIGNWIRDQKISHGPYFQVRSINSETEHDDKSGVRLKQSLLLDLGFKKVLGENNLTYWERGFLAGVDCRVVVRLFENSISWGETTYYFENIDGSYEVRYLHTLQNICFDLYRLDLNIRFQFGRLMTWNLIPKHGRLISRTRNELPVKETKSTHHDK